MKVKLKDLTAEQFKEWKKKDCNHLYCKECPFRFIECNEYTSAPFLWCTNKDMFSDKFLNQEVEIEGSILDNEEREFLQNLINALPKAKITCIVKLYYYYRYKEYLRIDYTNNSETSGMFFLPNFEGGSMYQGMERNKKYTLEELGLKQKGSN